MASKGSSGETTPTKPRNPHLANMAMLPDSRAQSYEELYGPPENLLEIEVCLPNSLATPSPEMCTAY